MSTPALAFSHMGLFVSDMDKIVKFYVDVMGFFVTDRGHLNGSSITFLSRNPYEHHQLVFVEGRNTESTTKLLNQMSFRLGSLGELIAFVANLDGKEVTNLEPVIHGNAWSIYFRDPEGNRAEVFADSDWYINQPIKEFLDFSLPEDEIRSRTLEFCKQQPGFRPVEEWRSEMRVLMGMPE